MRRSTRADWAKPRCRSRWRTKVKSRGGRSLEYGALIALGLGWMWRQRHGGAGAGARHPGRALAVLRRGQAHGHSLLYYGLEPAESPWSATQPRNSTQKMWRRPA